MNSGKHSESSRKERVNMENKAVQKGGTEPPEEGAEVTLGAEALATRSP